MSEKTSLTCRFFSIFALFLLLFQAGFAQKSLSGADEFFTRNQKKLGSKVVAMVVKDGQVLYKKESGDFLVKTSVPAAACTQWLTAAVVMKLVEEGKMDLDDPVANYIPIFSKYMKNYITIRHCLTHTTGIQEPKGAAGMLQKKKFSTLEEEVNAIAAREIAYKPGEMFIFSNTGLSIAARVAEVVTKKGFDRLLQEKITRPLKMRGTTVADDNGGAVNPGWGARTTAQDYAAFLSMLLNNGMFEDKQILTQESIDLICSVQTGSATMKSFPPAANGFGYGLGCWIQERDGNGNGILVSCPGISNCWVFINREKKYGAVVLTQNFPGEQKAELFEQLRTAIEEEL